MKGILLRKFRPTATGSLHVQWLHHHQSTYVVEYMCHFIELMAPLSGVLEEIVMGAVHQWVIGTDKGGVTTVGTPRLGSCDGYIGKGGGET